MKLKKNIITLIDYPDKNIKTNNYSVTLIIPLLEKAFKISNLNSFQNLLKKLLTRPKLIIKEKELNFLSYETVHVDKYITRKFSVVTNKNLVLHIGDYHDFTVDSLDDKEELSLIDKYTQNYETSIENLNKNIKLNYFIFNYSITDKPYIY
jgi:hypothetical protein